jgi:hypothetical protein
MEGYYSSMYPSSQDLSAGAVAGAVPPSLQQQQQIGVTSSGLISQMGLADSVDPHRGTSNDVLEDGGRLKRARYDFDEHPGSAEVVMQGGGKDNRDMDASMGHPHASSVIIPPPSSSIIATGPTGVGSVVVGGHVGVPTGGLSREEIAILVGYLFRWRLFELTLNICMILN